MLYDILTDDIAYWEECSAVDLKASFPKEYASLAKTLDEFRAATSANGAIDIPDLKVRAKELKRRLMKLEQQVSTTDSAGSSDSGVSNLSSDSYYCHDIKARAIPLPEFHGDLGDWNTFWTAFNEYIKKVKYITDREKYSYLQESIKDSVALDIVKDFARNGDTFASMGERLVEMYDRPREVYIMAVKELLSLPIHHYTKSSLVQMSKNLHRLRNILLKHRDGTADQLFTAIVEL